MSPLGNNIGRNLLQEAPRQEDAPTALALGQRARQFEPGLAAAGRIVRQIGELGREQERGLGKAQAGRDQQLGEERVAGAVAVSGAGPLGAVDVEATKSDITKYAVVFKGHEADVGSLGGALIGIVPRSNATVPGRGGDTRTSIFAPPCTMKRIDIHARSRPDRLAAGGVQKSNPHCDVIAVGAQRVGRANAVERQVKEETVEGGVVRDAVAENDRNVAVETFRRSALLDRDNGRRRQRKVIHGLCSPLPPDPNPRTCPRGQTGTSRARRFVARGGTARRARVPPVRYVDKSSELNGEPVQTVQIKLGVLRASMLMSRIFRTD